MNTLLKEMIYEKNAKKRTILQKKILQGFKTFKLQDMNTLDHNALLLICSWTYRYLMACSIERLSDEQKIDIFNHHQKILDYFPKDLTIAEYRWIMEEFQSYLYIYKSFDDKRLSNILNYLQDKVTWEKFLKHLKAQEDFLFKHYTNINKPE